jgi:hypothetical protein
VLAEGGVTFMMTDMRPITSGGKIAHAALDSVALQRIVVVEAQKRWQRVSTS